MAVYVPLEIGFGLGDRFPYYMKAAVELLMLADLLVNMNSAYH